MITCYFERGNKALLRHVVVDALIVKNNKVLLVQRSRTAIVEPSKYALPGGFLDRDENTIHAVVREVVEETGYKSKVKFLFEIIDKPERNDGRLRQGFGEPRQNVGFVYIVEVFGKRGAEDKKETAEVAWFELNNLPKSIGFDHREIIELYKNYLKKPFNLPIITS